MDALEIDRIKAGMQYESGRAGPPDDFPELPEIPAGRYVAAHLGLCDPCR